MGWSFSEFDQVPATDVFTLLEVWKIDGLNKNGELG